MRKFSSCITVRVFEHDTAIFQRVFEHNNPRNNFFNRAIIGLFNADLLVVWGVGSILSVRELRCRIIVRDWDYC